MPEKRPKQDVTVMQKFQSPIVNYAMTMRDRILRPIADPTTGPITITLPPVSDAMGYFYGIIARDADGTNTITIQDRDDSECWEGDITLNGPCDRALLYSDGLAWWQCCEALGFAGTTPAPTTAAP